MICRDPKAFPKASEIFRQGTMLKPEVPKSAGNIQLFMDHGFAPYIPTILVTSEDTQKKLHKSWFLCVPQGVPQAAFAQNYLATLLGNFPNLNRCAYVFPFWE